MVLYTCMLPVDRCRYVGVFSASLWRMRRGGVVTRKGGSSQEGGVPPVRGGDIFGRGRGGEEGKGRRGGLGQAEGAMGACARILLNWMR